MGIRVLLLRVGSLSARGSAEHRIYYKFIFGVVFTLAQQLMFAYLTSLFSLVSFGVQSAIWYRTVQLAFCSQALN